MSFFSSALQLCFLGLLSSAIASPVPYSVDDSTLFSKVAGRATAPEQVSCQCVHCKHDADRSRIPRHVLANAAFATTWLNASAPEDLAMSTTIVYTVPGTSTRLVIKVENNMIPATPMSSLILRTMNLASSHIQKAGDGHPLDQKEDPFWLDSKAGVVLGVWSSATPRLTYNQLGDTARGLWTQCTWKGSTTQLGL